MYDYRCGKERSFVCWCPSLKTLLPSSCPRRSPSKSNSFFRRLHPGRFAVASFSSILRGCTVPCRHLKCTLMEIDLEQVNLGQVGSSNRNILVSILIGRPEIVERIPEAIVAGKHSCLATPNSKVDT